MDRRNLRGAAWWLVAFGVMALSGCGDEQPVRPRGGTAVVVYAGAPASANPLVSTDTYSEELNRFLLYLPLFGLGPALELEPRLAESWRMEGDTAIVIRLRRGIQWSDGTPTSAHDVTFTLDRAADPATGSPHAPLLEHIGTPAVLDSFTVRLPLRPSREPLMPLALLPILPRHVLDTVPAKRLRTADFNRAPVTNGPFQVLARQTDRWSLRGNDSFPASLGGPPHLDRLVWRAIPESDAQLAELQAGEAHLVSGVRADAFARVGALEEIRAVERPTLSYTAIAWNARRPPLDDARVRRALTMAIDRGQIVRALRGGYGAVADGPVPPGHWAYDGSADPLPYDPAAARRLLDAAGLKDRDGDGKREQADGGAFRIRLLLPAGSDFNRDLAQVVQSDLAEVGIELSLRPQEFTTLVETITGPARNYDAVLIGLDADPRLDLRGLYHSEERDSPFQLAGYADPAMDSILDRIERTTDRDEGGALFGRAQEILRRDQPWTYLYFASNLILLRDELRGVEADLRGLMHSAPEWWLDAGEDASR
jgi:peptide/nickel transport system substrate-binding protein